MVEIHAVPAPGSHPEIRRPRRPPFRGIQPARHARHGHADHHDAGPPATRHRHAAHVCLDVRDDRGPHPAQFPAGDVFAYTLKESVGVVGAITPWNAPLTGTIWKIGPCRNRLHHGAEAGGGRAADRAAARRIGSGSRRSAGVVNVVPGLGTVAGAALAATWMSTRSPSRDRTRPAPRIIEASQGQTSSG